MSQEIIKRGKGRPPGSPNKNNIRMRDRFERAGFNYVKEVMETLGKMDSPEMVAPKMDALVKLAPYFMQRLREESEDKDTPSAGVVNNTQINLTPPKTTETILKELLTEVLPKKTNSQP